MTRTTSQRRMTIGLGTYIYIEAHQPESWLKASARPALDAACAAIEEVQALMDPERGDSDLARLAGAPVGTLVSINAWTGEVLSLARRICRSSGGVFDPCTPARPGRLTDLEIIEPQLVRKTGPDLFIDLGGIAKGYAIDRAIEALKGCGCTAGIVNAGGDLRVFGETDWPIEIHGGAGSRTTTLRESALAVSAAKSANSPPRHHGFYSRLDPDLTLEPDRVAVVCARDAATADALTKVALLCSPEMRKRIFDEYGARLLPD